MDAGDLPHHNTSEQDKEEEGHGREGERGGERVQEEDENGRCGLWRAIGELEEGRQEGGGKRGEMSGGLREVEG